MIIWERDDIVHTCEKLNIKASRWNIFDQFKCRMKREKISSLPVDEENNRNHWTIRLLVLFHKIANKSYRIRTWKERKARFFDLFFLVFRLAWLNWIRLNQIRKILRNRNQFGFESEIRTLLTDRVFCFYFSAMEITMKNNTVRWISWRKSVLFDSTFHLNLKGKENRNCKSVGRFFLSKYIMKIRRRRKNSLEP